MTSRRNCHVFELWNDGRIDSEEWMEHRERCPVCRVQTTVDRELRRHLGTMSRPRLSPGFQRRLLSQVADPRGAGGRGGRLWMYGYWLAAGIASLVLLARIEAASVIWSGWTLLAVAALAAGLVRRFGVDLVELIWWTAEATAGTDQVPLPDSGSCP